MKSGLEAGQEDGAELAPGLPWREVKLCIPPRPSAGPPSPGKGHVASRPPGPDAQQERPAG